MIYAQPSLFISAAKYRLYTFGDIIEQKTWQSVTAPDKFIDIMNFDSGFWMPNSIDELAFQVRPNLPWADEHFDERISFTPYNPPPSHERWPYAVKANHQFRTDEKFSHTYPERFWPKYAGEHDSASPRRGIRFEYGDYKDVINLLRKDPTTRQAFLPIWFPEDTGATQGQRVPCTLGYLFKIRDNKLHINYYIRSCDIIRHFRDDIYMACRLTYHILDQLNLDYELRPGTFTMYIASLHCFKNDKELLKMEKT